MNNEARIRELVKARTFINNEIDRLKGHDFWTRHPRWSVDSGELALAAAMYATPPEKREIDEGWAGSPSYWTACIVWPWDADAFKGGDET